MKKWLSSKHPMKKTASKAVLWMAFIFANHTALALPQGFVYLDELVPDIQQDMRYSKAYNFVGRPIPGYVTGRCILTRKAAEQLAKANREAMKKGYQLKVYDSYRPTRAVTAFYQWSQDKTDQKMKAEFYPREAKENLFERGYIAKHSGHSRGSTVDITLVRIGQSKAAKKPLIRCYAKDKSYLNDNSIDMGTRHDCLDISAYYHYGPLSKLQKQNRKLLKNLMTDHGFEPYSKEWWHFSLKNEPYPKQYFNFPVK